MIANASREDVIWLAGLAEGEATFDLQARKYPRFRVAMTDRDVVGRVATLVGCSIRVTLQPAPNKPTWHAEIQGPGAVAVMEALLPHMGARRSSKIAEILSRHYLADGDRARAYGKPLGRPPGLLSPTDLACPDHAA